MWKPFIVVRGCRSDKRRTRQPCRGERRLDYPYVFSQTQLGRRTWHAIQTLYGITVSNVQLPDRRTDRCRRQLRGPLGVPTTRHAARRFRCRFLPNANPQDCCASDLLVVDRCVGSSQYYCQRLLQTWPLSTDVYALF